MLRAGVVSEESCTRLPHFDTLDICDKKSLMAKVVMTPEAEQQMHKLPRMIRYRLHDVVDRLGRWPITSGAKPLRHALKGHYRIRTGDFRVMFRVVGDEVWIVRIEHRKEVYKD
jgi:mRNA-degrading endonuclease RelE of RelBE toxin-antitoxin system